MDFLPLWALFVVIIAIVGVSLELGYRFGHAAHRRRKDEKEAPASVISASVLGLGGFILAFTFGIVSNRFDTRKELVRQEASTLRTTWLRSDFLPPADNSESKKLLKRYLDSRLSFWRAGNTDPQSVATALADADSAQRRLWEIAVVNARKDLNSDVAALYIESLNELIAIHATRVTMSLQLRIPRGIWFELIFLTALGMMSLGYHTGIVGSRRSQAQPILAVAFAFVIAMITELDRPYGSFIRVPQQPLINVQSWMAARGPTK